MRACAFAVFGLMSAAVLAPSLAAAQVELPVVQFPLTPRLLARAREDYELGVRYSREGNYEDAIDAFEQSNELNPRASVARNLSIAYERAGRYMEAIRALGVALALDERAPTGQRWGGPQRRLLDEHRNELARRLAFVVVATLPANATIEAGPRAQRMPNREGAQVFAIDPGRHLVRFRAEGHVAEYRAIDAQVSPNSRTTYVTVSLRTEAPAEEPPTSQTLTPEQQSPLVARPAYVERPREPAPQYPAPGSFGESMGVASREPPMGPGSTPAPSGSRQEWLGTLAAVFAVAGGIGTAGFGVWTLAIINQGDELARSYTDQCVNVFGGAGCAARYEHTRRQLDEHASTVNTLIAPLVASTLVGGVGLLLLPLRPQSHAASQSRGRAPSATWRIALGPSGLGWQVRW